MHVMALLVRHQRDDVRRFGHNNWFSSNGRRGEATRHARDGRKSGPYLQQTAPRGRARPRRTASTARPPIIRAVDFALAVGGSAAARLVHADPSNVAQIDPPAVVDQRSLTPENLTNLTTFGPFSQLLAMRSRAAGSSAGKLYQLPWHEAHRLHRSVLFWHLQFALRRKVPLSDATIVRPHKGRTGVLGQLEEFLRRLQLTPKPARWVNHRCSPLGTFSTMPWPKRRGAMARCRECCWNAVGKLFF